MLYIITKIWSQARCRERDSAQRNKEVLKRMSSLRIIITFIKEKKMSLNSYKRAVLTYAGIEKQWEEFLLTKEEMYFIGDVMVKAILADKITVDTRSNRLVTTFYYNDILYDITVEGDDIFMSKTSEDGELLRSLHITNNGWDTNPNAQDILDKLFETLKNELAKKKGRYI